MGFREYARHRAAAGLVGGTLAAVQTAIKAGRIKYLQVDGAKKINQAEADIAWSETTNGGQAAAQGKPLGPGAPAAPRLPTPPADPPTDDGDELPGGISYAGARAAREKYMAELAKLEFLEKSGKLVDAEAVARRWEQVIGISRTKVLALPSKIRTRLPKLTAADVAVVEQLVRETLDELAAGD